MLKFQIRSFSQLLGAFFLLFGIVMLFFLLFTQKTIFELLEKGRKTSGVVFNKYRSVNTEQDFQVYKVSFIAQDGKMYQTKNFLSIFKEDIYNLKDTLQVIYLPENPQIARIFSFRETFGLLMIEVLLVVFFISIGLSLILCYSKIEALLAKLL